MSGMRSRGLLVAVLLGIVVPATPLLAVEPIDYNRDVKPLLQKKCYACHSAIRQKSGLRLDAAVLVRKGGDSGAAIVPGNSSQSLLIQKVTGTNGRTRMPPEGAGNPLTAEQVALLAAWIDQGAEAPADEETAEDPAEFWSFQPPVRPAVPPVKNKSWVLNPIDAFVAAERERRALKPRPPTAKATLLRRVYLDLVGLPPSRHELRAFLADDSSQAYESAVDRLLASPRYGERWGRHWMDVWRYSDWHGSGNEIRYGMRHLWRWRDWIVTSLNEDKGYDQMIVEMLAADEVTPTDVAVLPATGFIGRNWYKFDRNVWMRDLVEHTAAGFLAVTIKCARCHDHKFDPISQEDYYRLRAFFEPHDVRTDRVSMYTGYESFQDQGPVLKDGIPRVYDKTLDVPTFVFARGDDRYPEKDRPVAPGVPQVLGNNGIAIEAVPLPVEAYAPALSPRLLGERVALALSEVERAEKELAESEQAVSSVKAKLEHFAARQKAGKGKLRLEQVTKTVFRDDFQAPRADLWKVLSGHWEYREGRLVQSQVGSFLTMLSLVDHPRDFVARVRYKPTEPGKLHSVGIGFDVVGGESMQAIYTWMSGGKSGVQAFHRENGQEVYPEAGIVRHPLELNEEIALDIAARESWLNVWVNGELAIVYRMPMARRSGRLSLWNHSATAEYFEVQMAELPPELRLAEDKSERIPSPHTSLMLKDFDEVVAAARQTRLLAEKQVALANAELESLRARIAAEQAKYATPPPADAEDVAKVAARTERQAALLRAELNLWQSEQHLANLKRTVKLDDTDSQKSLAEAEKAVATNREAVETRRAALANDDGMYTPLAEVYPNASTGRRSALARWIVDPKNPRTARVAINHIWLRHFGRAIVDSVADFGLRAKPRSHPELLDWLAVELTEHGWRMKHIHRLIVTSNTYRQSSSFARGDPNLAIDPDNRYLWRMNSRRMEAEVVRDSILHLAGTLDTSMGGRELPATGGETVPRRSLYFQTAPNRQMELLELFDVANPDECYDRKHSVIPQQSLALMNSAVALSNARLLARALTETLEQKNENDNRTFVAEAFERVLCRPPTHEEASRCSAFLLEHARWLAEPGQKKGFPGASAGSVAPSEDSALRARENLVHVLFNHNDFVTIR